MILDGKKLAKELEEKQKQRVSKLDRIPNLVIVEVGDDPASLIYTRNKIAACERVGIKAVVKKLDENIRQMELNFVLMDLCKDNRVDAVMLQLPLPKHLDAKDAITFINYNKDADCMCSSNQATLFHNNDNFVTPCTPAGIIKLLDAYNINLDGANVTIVGRSNIVGKPLAMMLTNRNATVTLCHSHTDILDNKTFGADIVISAVGQPGIIYDDMISDGAVVVDVGINRVDGHLVGDVDFNSVCNRVKAITPVPGGVGPMTISSLIDNIIGIVEHNMHK